MPALWLNAPGWAHRRVSRGRDCGTDLAERRLEFVGQEIDCIWRARPPERAEAPQVDLAGECCLGAEGERAGHIDAGAYAGGIFWPLCPAISQAVSPPRSVRSSYRTPEAASTCSRAVACAGVPRRSNLAVGEPGQDLEHREAARPRPRRQLCGQEAGQRRVRRQGRRASAGAPSKSRADDRSPSGGGTRHPACAPPDAGAHRPTTPGTPSRRPKAAGGTPDPRKFATRKSGSGNWLSLQPRRKSAMVRVQDTLRAANNEARSTAAKRCTRTRP